jgi:hypothetical protein
MSKVNATLMMEGKQLNFQSTELNQNSGGPLGAVIVQMHTIRNLVNDCLTKKLLETTKINEINDDEGKYSTRITFTTISNIFLYLR